MSHRAVNYIPRPLTSQVKDKGWSSRRTVLHRARDTTQSVQFLSKYARYEKGATNIAIKKYYPPSI